MSPVGPNAEYAMFGDWLSSLQNRELFFYGVLLLMGIGMETAEGRGGAPDWPWQIADTVCTLDMDT